MEQVYRLRNHDYFILGYVQMRDRMAFAYSGSPMAGASPAATEADLADASVSKRPGPVGF